MTQIPKLQIILQVNSENLLFATYSYIQLKKKCYLEGDNISLNENHKPICKILFFELIFQNISRKNILIYVTIRTIFQMNLNVYDSMRFGQRLTVVSKKHNLSAKLCDFL